VGSAEGQIEEALEADGSQEVGRTSSP